MEALELILHAATKKNMGMAQNCAPQQLDCEY
jgi:hypothetical protein